MNLCPFLQANPSPDVIELIENPIQDGEILDAISSLYGFHRRPKGLSAFQAAALLGPASQELPGKVVLVDVTGTGSPARATLEQSSVSVGTLNTVAGDARPTIHDDTMWDVIGIEFTNAGGTMMTDVRLDTRFVNPSAAVEFFRLRELEPSQFTGVGPFFWTIENVRSRPGCIIEARVVGDGVEGIGVRAEGRVLRTAGGGVSFGFLS